MLAPCRHDVRLVEAHRDADRLPQPLLVRLAEDLLGPARIRRRADRPTDVPAEDDPARFVRQVERRRRQPCRVDAVEQARIRTAGQPDQRAAVALVLADARERPVRRRGQRLEGCMQHGRSAHIRVGVVDLDATRTGQVGLLDDGTNDRSVHDVGGDGDALPGLHICADLYDELGIAGQSVIGRHLATVSVTAAFGISGGSSGPPRSGTGSRTSRVRRDRDAYGPACGRPPSARRAPCRPCR